MKRPEAEAPGPAVPAIVRSYAAAHSSSLLSKAGSSARHSKRRRPPSMFAFHVGVRRPVRYRAGHDALAVFHVDRGRVDPCAPAGPGRSVDSGSGPGSTSTPQASGSFAIMRGSKVTCPSVQSCT